eukprot:GFYU01005597.1.p1 GENE.GFYU01005597.1~~GFYU01005597.1.p1  ORF type:complete len:254 (+),score=55.98 GFYU01005597.1:186-947(+)
MSDVAMDPQQTPEQKLSQYAEMFEQLQARVAVSEAKSQQLREKASTIRERLIMKKSQRMSSVDVESGDPLAAPTVPTKSLVEEYVGGQDQAIQVMEDEVDLFKHTLEMTLRKFRENKQLLAEEELKFISLEKMQGLLREEQTEKYRLEEVQHDLQHRVESMLKLMKSAAVDDLREERENESIALQIMRENEMLKQVLELQTVEVTEEDVLNTPTLLSTPVGVDSHVPPGSPRPFTEPSSQEVESTATYDPRID